MVYGVYVSRIALQKSPVITGLSPKTLAKQPDERSQIEQEILDACRQELTETDIAILKKARDEGAFNDLREE
jgi:hypothetical protein